MTVAVETVKVVALDIVASTPIPVAIPVFSETDVEVTYGIDGLVAVYNTDYTVELEDETDFDTFTLTPTASLLTKINDLIADDDEEINKIVIARVLDFKTSATSDAVKNTTYTSREFDRTAARFQQVNEIIGRALRFAKTYAGTIPTIGNLIPGDGLKLSLDGTRIESGLSVAGLDQAVADAEDARDDAQAALTSATTQAGLSNTARLAAEAARDQALASFDGFDDVYLGPKAANPTLDNDGNALVEGQLYWNSVANELRFYDGAAWIAYSLAGYYSISQVDTLLLAKANDSAVVHNTGNETVAGIKTFSSTPVVPNASWTLAKLADATALSVLGRSANSAGAYADMAAGSDGHVLRRSGTTLGFGQIAAGAIPNSILTFAMMATAAVSTGAEYLANTASKLLSVAAVWAAMAEVSQTETQLTTGIDLATGMDFTVTLTAARTMGNFSNVKVGQRGRIRFVQNATGGWVVTKASNMKTPAGGALVIATAANAESFVYYDCVSSTKILLSNSPLAWS